MKTRNQRSPYRAGIYLVKRVVVLASSVAALLVLSCGNGPRSSLDTGPPGADVKSVAMQVRTYDADAGHIWNRLHSALFVRATSEGVNYGQDELDPLLWPESRFLLVGEHHKHVVALLDEFLAKDGDKLIKDPLKRAVFQHDLWAIFDWLAHPGVVYGSRSDECTPEERALQIRLAKIILRLAPSPEQIQQLPDNYARDSVQGLFNQPQPGEAGYGVSAARIIQI